MYQHVYLIIFLSNFFLKTLLLGIKEGGRIEIINSSLIRLPLLKSSQSQEDFVYEYIEAWGKSIGWQFFDSKLLISPNKEKRGVDKFVLALDSDVKIQNQFSEKIIHLGCHIDKEKTIIIGKTFDFNHLYFLNLDFNKVSLSILDLGNGVIKVKNISKEIDKQNLISNISFRNKIKKIEGLLKNKVGLIDKVCNSLLISPSTCSKKLDIIIQLIIYLQTVVSSLRETMLDCGFDNFEKNILVVGGELTRIVENDNTTIFLASSILECRGLLKVFVDKYGFSEVAQHELLKSNIDAINFDNIYNSYYLIKTKPEKKQKLSGDICAEITVVSKEGIRKNYYPMINRIIPFQVEKNAHISLKLGCKKEIETVNILNKKASKYFFDSRLSDIYDDSNFVSNFLLWLDSIKFRY